MSIGYFPLPCPPSLTFVTASQAMKPVAKKLAVDWGTVGFECALRPGAVGAARTIKPAANSAEYPRPVRSAPGAR